MIQFPSPFITAVRTLTALRIWGKEDGTFASSLSYFGAVGLVIGVLQYLLALAFFSFLPPFSLASILIVFHLLVTRAFHLDGLADMADGFGGGWTKDRIAEIMKDSRVGAFGAISVAALLIVKCAGLTDLLSDERLLYLLYVPVFSRTALVLTARVFPYAFEQGTAGEIINGARWLHVFFNLLISSALILLLSFESYAHLFILLAVAIAAQMIVAFKSTGKIGGISGDILGASLEVSEAALYIAIAFFA